MYARELPGAEGEDVPGDPDTGEDSLEKPPGVGVTTWVAPEALPALFLPL